MDSTSEENPLSQPLPRNQGRGDHPFDQLRWRILLRVISWAIRLLARTWRVRFEGYAPAFPPNRPQADSLIYPFWHSRILTLTSLYRGKPVCVMVSTHRDGEAIARIAGMLGFTFVRGSTTREGLRALLELAGIARKGHDVAITPDGPRGPREVLQIGTVILAQKSRRPLVLITTAARSAWRTRSWDAQLIPKPFARVICLISEPIAVPDEKGIDIEAIRLDLESRLRELTRRAEEMVER